MTDTERDALESQRAKWVIAPPTETAVARAEKAEADLAALRNRVEAVEAYRDKLRVGLTDTETENAALRARVEALEGAMRGLRDAAAHVLPENRPTGLLAKASAQTRWNRLRALAGGSAEKESAGALTLSREEAELAASSIACAEVYWANTGKQMDERSALRARIAAWLEGE